MYSCLKFELENHAANPLLMKLAARVHELFRDVLATRRPLERAKLSLLYQEAYLAHKTHKLFLGEQYAKMSA